MAQKINKDPNKNQHIKPTTAPVKIRAMIGAGRTGYTRPSAHWFADLENPANQTIWSLRFLKSLKPALAPDL